MASNRMRTIFDSQVKQFVSYFSYDAKNLFYDESKKLIHPGEFGKYREEACKRVLRTLLEKNIDIADGFVITSDDAITTQCDIIGYNSMISPIISDGIAKVFPTEEVYAIGEIKSTLTRKGYIEALQKMAKNKETILKGRKGGRINKIYKTKTYDTITSFLICGKLDFDINSLSYEEIYGDINRRYWHNLILSIENGYFSYALDFRKASKSAQEILKEGGYNIDEIIAIDYPLYNFQDEWIHTIENHINPIEPDKYDHIKRFWVGLATSIKEVWRYEYDPIMYLGYNMNDLWS